MNVKKYENIPQQRNRIYISTFKYKKNLNKFKFTDMIPLTQTAFDLFDKKQDDKYYMDNRNIVYCFTDWGLSRGMKGICPKLLVATENRFERIPCFYDDYLVRLMTHRECARLQGFPESFILPKENENKSISKLEILLVFL